MVRHTARSVVLAALLVVSVAAGSIAFSGAVAAAEDGAIDADPADPGATNATHKTTVEITASESGNALSDIYVNYSVDPAYNGTTENVTVDDVKRVGIDMDEDGDIDRNATDLKNVLHPSNGTLVFDFGGDTDLEQNESVIVVYDNTTNPGAAGNYTVELDVNTGSKFDPVNATLRIGENVTDDETGETYDTPYEPAADHDEIIDSEPPTPGVTATHHVAIATSSNEVGNSLSNIVVNYHADGSFDGSVQDVGIGDVEQVGFSVDSDPDIEISTMDDLKGVSTSNVGETVTFDFGGNYGIKDDYTVIIVYGDAENPSSGGNYAVEADINSESTANPRTGSLTLANFTFRNLTLRNYTATNTTFANTTVLNATWTNATLTNSTFTNATQNWTAWENVTVRNATWNDTAFVNATWRNVTVANSTWTAANVTNATFVNATWNATTLRNDTVTNATFVNTTATNLTVTNSTLTNVTFRNVTAANLTLANVTWRNVTVTNATLANTTVRNATWSDTNVTAATWENTTVTGAFNDTVLADVTMRNVTWNATSALRNTTWRDSVFRNATFAGTTFDNSTADDASFLDVNETGIRHSNVTLRGLTVDHEDVETAVLSDKKFKKEKNYLKRIAHWEKHNE